MGTPHDLGKEAPSEHPGTQVDAVGVTVIDPRQPRLHHLREYDRVDDDHREWIEYRPGGAEHGVAVLELELSLHTPQHKAAVAHK